MATTKTTSTTKSATKKASSKPSATTLAKKLKEAEAKIEAIEVENADLRARVSALVDVPVQKPAKKGKLKPNRAGRRVYMRIQQMPVGMRNGVVRFLGEGLLNKLRNG